jgi:hypothetical protein
MGPGPVRIVAGGNRREGTRAAPGAGWRARMGIFVLATAAALAALAGTMAGATAAHAATAAPAHAATAAPAHAATAAPAHPRFEPCPCINPVCRPGCDQNMAAGGPASMIGKHTRLTAAHAQPGFEPCPCADPVCRPACFQSSAPEPGEVGAGSPGYLRYVRE